MAAPLDLWATILAGPLHEIVGRIPCEVERLRLPLVCKRWREALWQLPSEVPPQLPWLLRPFHCGPAFSCLLGGGGAGASSIHRLRVPTFARAGRYFGSYEGRYLFLAYRSTTGHTLFNLRTGVIHRLPDELIKVSRVYYPIVMLAATLSSAPGQDRCVGAAIVDYADLDNQIAFWHMGHYLAKVLSPDDAGPAWDMVAEDVVYHNGAFHVLTQRYDILVCTPAFDQNEVLQRVNTELRHFVVPDQYGDDQHDHVRYGYLVVSRGELLLVVKSAPDCKIFDRRTSPWTFTVLRMRQQEEDGLDHYAWTEVPALDGRILFLGRGCSRSYEVVDFPGFQDGVYFMDDEDSYDYLRITQELPYPCLDNGKWSSPPPVIERCFPPDQDTSIYSPPVWLLP